MCGLFPFPLLCLHVSCHHLWRTLGGGYRRTHSKSHALSSECSVFCQVAVHCCALYPPCNTFNMTTVGVQYDNDFFSNYPPIIFLSFPNPKSAIESLFGASLTGIAYSLFAGQPLTILGSTGPVLVFEKILFKFCKYVLFSCEFKQKLSLWTIMFNLSVHCDYIKEMISHQMYILPPYRALHVLIWWTIDNFIVIPTTFIHHITDFK